MAKLKYKMVSLKTLKGLEKATQLQQNGWRIISFDVSSNTIIMEKTINFENED